MIGIPNLSTREIDVIQNRRSNARDDLQNALLLYWHELGNVNPGARSEAGRPGVIQFLGAYVGTIFDVEAEIYVRSSWKPVDLSARLDELALRVSNEVMPPQFHVNSGFYLGDLHYDDAYRSHIAAVLQDRLDFLKKKHIPHAKRPDDFSPREIIDGYRKQERLTNKELAGKASVDVSVIYAIKAERKKQGPEAIKRVATVIGCEPSQLLPKK